MTTSRSALPRRQQALLALAPATRILSSMLMGTAMAVYVGEAGTPFAVSMVFTAYFVALMVFAPMWGAIADITGRRRAVLVATGVLATAAVLPLTVISGVWGPVGLRGLYAVFAAGTVPVMLSIVSAHGGAEGRGRAIGFFNSARGVGFTAGQLLAGVLLGLLLPADLYLFIAGASLISTLAMAGLSDPTPTPGRRPSAAMVAAEVKRRLLPAVDDRAHLRTNGLRWLYVALALRNMTVLGVGSLLPPYLLGDVGVSTTVMGVILALNPAGQTVFMYVFGRVADAIGRKPLIVSGMAGSALFGVVAAGATLPASPLARRLVAASALVVLGAGYSAMTTGALAFIGDVAPTVREGELMGLRDTAKGVGGTLGPPLLGGLATVLSYEASFALGSLLALAATALVAVSLTETRPAEVPVEAAPEDD